MSEPLVTIIIPVFNREALVHYSVESCLQQTYRNLEILCIDDSSSDGSVAVVEGYAAADERVKLLINQRTKGVAGARNTGLLQASGKYIAFLDSDDRYKPFHIEKMVALLESNEDVDWVYADFERRQGDSVKVDSVFRNNELVRAAKDTVARGELQVREGERQAEWHLLYERIAGLHTSVVRRSVIERCLFDESLVMFEDWYFRFEALKAGFKLAYLFAVHHEYYIHDANLCSSDTAGDIAKKDRTVQQFRLLLEKVFARNDLTPGERKALHTYGAQKLFWDYGYWYEKAGDLQRADAVMWQATVLASYAPLYLSRYLYFWCRKQLSLLRG